MELPYTIYILKCANGQYYTGYTSNISERFRAHQKGQVSFTKSKRPVVLIYLSQFSKKQQAYNFERYLKSGSGKAFRNKRLV